MQMIILFQLFSSLFGPCCEFNVLLLAMFIKLVTQFVCPINFLNM